MAHILAGLAVLLLFAAAWNDLATRTIPNRLCAGLAAVTCAAQLLHGPLALAMAAGTAVLLFGALVVPFAFGALGGGDVKLAPALALGLSPVETWHFVFLTALAGGALGLAYIVVSQVLRLRHARRGAGAEAGVRRRPAALPRGLVHRVISAELHRIRRRHGLPYGVAIAAGGITMLLPVLLRGAA